MVRDPASRIRRHEIVADAVSGWVCDDPTELPAALRRVTDLDPAACVAHVRARFTADLMAGAYERLYRQVIVDRRRPRRSAPLAAAPGPRLSSVAPD